MNNSVTVQEGQNMLDLSIQHLGDQSGIFALALANNMSITAVIAPGAKMILPNVVNKEVGKLFYDKQYIPATDSAASIAATKKGIGTMIIGTDFKIG